MITKEKKNKIINELKQMAEAANSVIFVNFHGESVVKTSALRRELRKKFALYKVAKKTLVEKSFEGENYKGKFTDFKGELAAIFNNGDDMVGVLKHINSLVKEGKFKILGGVFEKEYRDAEFMIAISKLPPKEVILQQLLGLLNSPVKSMVDALSGGIINFIRVLDQIAKAKK